MTVDAFPDAGGSSLQVKLRGRSPVKGLLFWAARRMAEMWNVSQMRDMKLVVELIRENCGSV